jgi:hypothetical protein
VSGPNLAIIFGRGATILRSFYHAKFVVHERWLSPFVAVGRIAKLNTTG